MRDAPHCDDRDDCNYRDHAVRECRPIFWLRTSASIFVVRYSVKLRYAMEDAPILLGEGVLPERFPDLLVQKLGKRAQRAGFEN